MDGTFLLKEFVCCASRAKRAQSEKIVVIRRKYVG